MAKPRLTVEEAQARLDDKFPDSQVVLTTFGGVDRPCVLKHPVAGEAHYATFSSALRSPDTHSLIQAIQRKAQNQPPTTKTYDDDIQPTSLVPNPLTQVLEMINSDWCKVPFYPDISFVGGYGEMGSSDEYYDKTYMDFDRKVLQQRNINPNHVVCFTLRGNSLEPIIYAGATLALDTNDNERIIDGKIYAFVHDGARRVKVLRKLPEGKVLVESKNPDYEDEVADAEDIRLIGRVFWYSQEI